MATSGATVRIRGMAELRRKLGDGLIARPARNFLNRAGTAVQSNSRKRAPNYRGLLMNSIAVEVDKAALPMWVRIGPNISVGGAGGAANYAEAQEFGTKPFWPPKGPLEEWGRRKGLTPKQVFLVRRAISRKGIKPKGYMSGGLKDTMPKIPSLVEKMAQEIEAQASAGGTS